MSYLELHQCSVDRFGFVKSFLNVPVQYEATFYSELVEMTINVYTVSHKNVPLYLYYNSGTSWWIFTLYMSVETGMNTLQNRRKI